MSSEVRYAVVRLKSVIRSCQNVRDNLRHIRLNRVNTLVFYQAGDFTADRLKRVDSLVSYGRIDLECWKSVFECCLVGISEKLLARYPQVNTLGELGELYWREPSRFRTDACVTNSFRLHPPIGGLGRFGKSRKTSRGGCIGPRENLTELVRRMVQMTA